MMNWGDARLPDRFWRKAIPEPMSGCWLWIGCTRLGYGIVRVGTTTHGAHRVCYEAINGSVPDGLELDHLCRTRCCVNPAHLEPVTHAENVRRGEAGAWQRSKTHCANGHPYEGDNLKVVNGERLCVQCTRANGRASWHRRNPDNKIVTREQRQERAARAWETRRKAI